MKYYKVNLYRYTKYRKVEAIEKIIVRNGIFHAAEIITNLNLRILPNKQQMDGLETQQWLKKYGQFLFLLEEDFSNKNIVLSNEINFYLDHFQLEKSKLNDIILANQKEKALKKRLKKESR